MQRLSGLDASFLYLESPEMPMHVGALHQFELPADYRGDFAADLNVSLADNAQQRAWVTGHAVPVPSGFDLATVTMELTVNGAVAERALGREVLGTPAASIAWLANKLAELGLALEAGMKVMSGSFTRQYPLGRGDRIEARFDPAGPVRAELV